MYYSGGLELSFRSEAGSLWPTQEERSLERDLKREAILQMAARFFVERGFHRTKLNDIADALGVSKTVIYHHFDSKNALLIESNRRGVRFIVASMDEIEQAHATGRARIDAFLRSFVKIVVVDVGASLAMVDDGDLAEPDRKQIRADKRVVSDRLRDYIRQGTEDGTVMPCDVTVAVNVILGALNSISLWYRVGGRLNVDQLADHIANLFGNGLYPADAKTSAEPTKPAKAAKATKAAKPATGNHKKQA